MRQRGRLALGAFLLVLTLFAFYAKGRGQTAPEPTRVRDVIYGKKEGVALTLDVFKPTKPNGAAVLWIVSGGWFSSHDGINPGVAQYFTKRGYTVFEVVHGSQPRFAIPDAISDIQRAVRFIRTNATQYGIDPERIGVSGASAGGHLSLMIGATGVPGKADAKDPVDRASSQVKAIGCFFPPTDFINWGKPGVTVRDTENLRFVWPAFRFTDSTPKAEVEEVCRKLSPIYSLTKEMPPTLVIHGDADTLVPIQQAGLLMKRLDELSVPHQLNTKPGKGHGWPDNAGDFEAIADWFDKYLSARH